MRRTRFTQRAIAFPVPDARKGTVKLSIGDLEWVLDAAEARELADQLHDAADGVHVPRLRRPPAEPTLAWTTTQTPA